jgi:hypothetical protein
MSNKNLFSFEYQDSPILNKDGKPSNFRQVYGESGNVIVCPKSSYHLVKTADLSNLGNAFIDKGHEVSTFTHREGELIGLNVRFGQKPSKVGDCTYDLYVTVPNNGAGRGFLSIKQVRLICTNGMVSSKTIAKDNSIKIPHTINYNQSLELMKQSIDGFMSLFSQIQIFDEAMDSKKLSLTDIKFHLNKWFFEQELPKSQVGDLTLDSFRRALAIAPETVPSIARYNELIDAYNKELAHNETLNLQPSLFTAYAAITNYLSRRVEKSGSVAANEIMFSRSSDKLSYFDKLVTV